MASSEQDEGTEAEAEQEQEQPEAEVVPENWQTDVQVWPIEDIHPYVNNAKEHPDEQVEKIRSSIKNYGWDQPIVVDESGEIIKGHGRRLAAKSLGLERVPVIVRDDLTEGQKKAARIADNRSAESAWDEDSLEAEFEALNDDADFSWDLPEGTGFEQDEIDAILGANDVGSSSGDFEVGSLEADFGVPPFSVLNTTRAYWTQRREQWNEMGLDTLTSTPARENAMVDGEGGGVYTGNWAEDEGIGGGVEGTGTSVFDPVLAELLYRWFAPEGGSVLDPFAGGPARAVVASVTGREYHGIDINPEQVEHNRNTWSSIGPQVQATAGPAELPESLDNRPDPTPIEKHEDENGDTYWFKREDAYTVAGVNGSKVRGYFKIADGASGIVGGIARVSPNHSWIAAVGKRLGIPVRLHTAHGARTEPMELAERLGAEVIQHKPGYMSQVRSEAKKDAEQREGWVEMPLAGKHPATHAENVRAVRNLKEVEGEVNRIVIPMGSGFSCAGLLQGLDEYDIDIPVLGVRVGIDVAETMDEFAPEGWREREGFEMVDASLEYEERPEQTSLAGVPLDPIYEAKALEFVEPGDLFYVVATRETELDEDDPRWGITSGDHPDVPREDNRPSPTWYEGDAAQTAQVLADNEAPEQFDFVFSCPPYHDLEQYTDNPADLSQMEYDEFLEAYREAITDCVEHLKDNRFAAFVVSEIRDDEGYYRGFVKDTVQAFEDAGMRLYNDAVLVNSPGTLPVRVRNYFEKGRKLGRQHQNVLVFYKGDPTPDAIRDAIGEVRVPDGVVEQVQEDAQADAEGDE